MDYRKLTKITRNMQLYKNKVNKGKLELNDTEFEMVRFITKRSYRSLVEVASYLNVDKSLVTRMAKKLARLGYLEIHLDEADSRKKCLVATEKAFSIKNEIASEEVKFYEACVRVLTEDELNTFDRLLDKVYEESKKLRKSNFQEVVKNDEAL